MREIERKWIIIPPADGSAEQLPYLQGLTPLPYERHFLFDADGIEVRIQKKGDNYEFERKEESSDLTRTGQKFQISQAEFGHFKQYAIGSIERESYQLGEVSVKVYRGRHEGLIRAEVEFGSGESAKAYTPPDWFGPEITDSPLGKDKRLVGLGGGELSNLISVWA